jgi:ABC-type uncharacterized transport system ATPase component
MTVASIKEIIGNLVQRKQLTKMIIIVNLSESIIYGNDLFIFIDTDIYYNNTKKKGK